METQVRSPSFCNKSCTCLVLGCAQVGPSASSGSDRLVTLNSCLHLSSYAAAYTPTHQRHAHTDTLTGTYPLSYANPPHSQPWRYPAHTHSSHMHIYITGSHSTDRYTHYMHMHQVCTHTHSHTAPILTTVALHTCKQDMRSHRCEHTSPSVCSCDLGLRFENASNLARLQWDSTLQSVKQTAGTKGDIPVAVSLGCLWTSLEVSF